MYQDIAVARGSTYDTLNKRMDRCQENIETVSDDIQRLQGESTIQTNIQWSAGLISSLSKVESPCNVSPSKNEWMVRIKRLQLGASLPHLGVSKVCQTGALPRKVWANTHYNCWQWGYWRPLNSLDTSAVSVNFRVFGLPWIEVCVILRSGLNRLRLLIPLAEAKATWPEMAVEQASTHPPAKF